MKIFHRKLSFSYQKFWLVCSGLKMAKPGINLKIILVVLNVSLDVGHTSALLEHGHSVYKFTYRIACAEVMLIWCSGIDGISSSSGLLLSR